MSTRTRRSLTGAIAIGLASGLTVAGCSSSKSPAAPASSTPSGAAASSAGALQDLSGKSIQVLAEWSGTEQKNFQKVIDAFTAKTHASVTYQGAGDQTVTVLQSKIAGGGAPDVALIAQPGAIVSLANKGSIKPLSSDVLSAIDADYAPGWKTLGTVNGQVYSIMFKVANKSTFWYNTAQFQQAGVTPPKTWDEFKAALTTLKGKGEAPLGLGTSPDTWSLTDWFESIYIRQAGPDKYDQLFGGKLPWTDPSVATAVDTMKEVLNDNFVNGGIKAANGPCHFRQMNEIWVRRPVWYRHSSPPTY